MFRQGNPDVFGSLSPYSRPPDRSTSSGRMRTRPTSSPSWNTPRGVRSQSLTENEREMLRAEFQLSRQRHLIRCAVGLRLPRPIGVNMHLPNTLCEALPFKPAGRFNHFKPQAERGGDLPRRVFALAHPRPSVVRYHHPRGKPRRLPPVRRLAPPSIDLQVASPSSERNLENFYCERLVARIAARHPLSSGFHNRQFQGLSRESVGRLLFCPGEVSHHAGGAERDHPP